MRYLMKFQIYENKMYLDEISRKINEINPVNCQSTEYEVSFKKGRMC